MDEETVNVTAAALCVYIQTVTGKKVGSGIQTGMLRSTNLVVASGLLKK